MKKLNMKTIALALIKCLLIGIVSAIVLVCLFFLIIGIAAADPDFFGYGIAGLAGTIGVPLVIQDIKDLFF